MSRREHGSLHAASLALAIVVACAAPLRAQSVGDQARAIATRGGYQIELPGAASREFRESRGDGGGSTLQSDGAERREPAWSPGPQQRESAKPGLNALWILLGVAAVLIVARAVRLARGRITRDVVFRADPAGSAATAPADFDPGDTPLTAAERLARDGHFARAVRALLAGTIDALRSHGTAGVPRSMTGRVLVRSAPLRDVARQALLTLVDEVERTLFAGRDAGAADFARCAEAFRLIRSVHREDAT
ncbi:MAG: hypothetical protein HZB39_02300 [Planctomycetes bacterium]|nr:hypothetical protein [Planctomycetota bacterium]